MPEGKKPKATTTTGAKPEGNHISASAATGASKGGGAGRADGLQVPGEKTGENQFRERAAASKIQRAGTADLPGTIAGPMRKI